jgi:hypothetical protein
MRYILIGTILTLFLGCGSTDNSQGEDMVKPTPPITKDRDKEPPSIPNI